MKASELIRALEAQIAQHGDHPVVIYTEVDYDTHVWTPVQSVQFDLTDREFCLYED